MAGRKEKNDDLYAVLGLKKECTEAELKNAYKKLALVILINYGSHSFIFCIFVKLLDFFFVFLNFWFGFVTEMASGSVFGFGEFQVRRRS